METFIVYLDDASYAEHLLTPMLGHNAPAHWVLVACAPRMGRHINKWLHHSARENWRNRWCDKLFAHIQPLLTAHSTTQPSHTAPVIERVVATGSLTELTQKLRTTHGAARVVDMRRPKFGYEMPPVTQEQSATHSSTWQVPGAVGGMSAMLMLAAD
jgi:hypothetical protein